jgi:hypothetical protein
MISLQQIFQTYGPEYVSRFGKTMPKNHKKVIARIINCRTADCGTVLYRCGGCGHIIRRHRSCGDRHCPTCQYANTQDWLEKHLKRQLPTPYFLITFTVPEPLRVFLRKHTRDGYNALFAASSETLKAFAADLRYCGVSQPGFFGVLHTWGGQMQYHPHIHYVVVGGGLSKDHTRWQASPARFFAPVKGMSKLFRGRFQRAMKKNGLFKEISVAVWKQAFNVNCQAVGSAENTLRYLAAYVFRIAISNHRIIKVENDRVFFRYQKKGTRVRKVISLPAMEFMRRFLQHVLPKGFVKIRYYGFLAPAAKVEWGRLRTLIQLSGNAVSPVTVEEEKKAEKEDDPAKDLRCPGCGEAMIYMDTLLPVRGQLVSVAGMQRKRKEQKKVGRLPGG